MAESPSIRPGSAARPRDEGGQHEPLETEDLTSSHASPAELADLGSQWLDTVTERWRLRWSLVVEETKLAFTTILIMLFLSIVAAGMALVAWISLMLVFGQWLIGLGLGLGWTSALFVFIHLVLVAGLALLIRNMSAHLQITAGRRPQDA